MKKKWIVFVLSFALLLGAVFALGACAGVNGTSGGVAVDGTYYLYKNGQQDKTVYIKIDGEEWSGSTGDSGKCQYSDGDIAFYGEIFGEQVIVAKGTVSGGVLTIINRTSAGTEKIYYCKDGYAPADGDSQPGDTDTGKAKITVTYNANGGTFAGGEVTYLQTGVTVGSTLTAPASPTRNGHAFSGWAKNKNGSEMWDFATDEALESITLYAVWREESAKIFSVDGASINDDNIFMLVDNNVDSVFMSSKIVCSSDSTWKLYYDKLGQTEIPTKIAAQLNGALNNGNNVFYVVVTSKDATQVNVYTLTIHRRYYVPVRYYNGAELLKTDNVLTGNVFNVTYTPVITGYTFNKWITATGDYVSTELYGPLDLFANKTAKQYTVTLDVNGGDELASDTKTVTFDSSYTLATPTRTGYDFLGWCFDNTKMTDEHGNSLTAWHYTQSMRLSAEWQDENLKYLTWIKNGSSYVVTGVRDKSITSLRIPDLITDIEEGALSGCSKLENLTIPFVGRNKSSTLIESQCLFGYIFGTKSYAGGTNVEQHSYKNAVNWNVYTCYIPTGLKNITITGGNILNGAFSNCSGLTSITLPDSVTSIGTYAFSGCRGLTSVNIPNSVTSIGNIAFSYCSSLISITIPNSVTSIGDSVFSGCSGLTSITIPDSVTSIVSSAFYDCSSLASITIPDSVTSIGGGAFHGCSGLTSITIPDSVTSIGYGVFWACSGLTNITIPNSVMSIGGYAFYRCSRLMGVTIPDGVTSIGECAFDSCSGLTSITIPNSVTSIGRQAFRNCSRLVTVNWNAINCVPESDNSNIFYGCTSIATINIGEDVQSIPSNAFCGCTGFTSITIPNSVMSIGYDTFYGCSGLASVYYKGSQSEWSNISIDRYNDSLTSATRYYYSETQPISSGNYWHYDTDGVTPVVW